MIIPLVLAALQTARCGAAAAGRDDSSSPPSLRAGRDGGRAGVGHDRSIERDRSRRLGLPLASDLLRLAPGVSVSTTGARGHARRRSASAAPRPTTRCVFIDGIAFNDPRRRQRGPLRDADRRRARPARVDPRPAIGALGIGGARRRDRDGQPRSAGRAAAPRRRANMAAATARARRREVASGGDNAGLSATATCARSDGIDIVGGGARRPRRLRESDARACSAVARFGDVRAGRRGRYIHHDVDFDGTDPVTFARADTPTPRPPRPARCAAGLAMARCAGCAVERARRGPASRQRQPQPRSARLRTTDTLGPPHPLRRPAHPPLRARRDPRMR